MTKKRRKPIVIEFQEPVDDDMYLSVANAVMAVMDLAGEAGTVHVTMNIDPELDAAYDEMDVLGKARADEARRRGKQ